MLCLHVRKDEALKKGTMSNDSDVIAADNFLLCWIICGRAALRSRRGKCAVMCDRERAPERAKV